MPSKKILDNFQATVGKIASQKTQDGNGPEFQKYMSTTPVVFSLKDYIDRYFDGSTQAFAEAQFTKEGNPIRLGQVYEWIRMGCIVVDNVLYSPRRSLNR